MSHPDPEPSAPDLPRPGEAAPPFALPSDGGAVVTLAGLAGRAVALFVYPGDATPSCTVEARDFTALADDFAAVDTVVLGLSTGTPAAKARFRDKAGLGVPLLADEAGDTLRAYGAWGTKRTFGRTYEGVRRMTFLIDPTGRVARTWEVGRVRGHASEVLAAARALHPR